MNLSLLQQTGCVKFLHTFEMSPKVRELQAERESLRAIAVSSLGYMTHQGSKHYPYKASFEKNRWDPVLILHSSGSTGELPLGVETR